MTNIKTKGNIQQKAKTILNADHVDHVEVVNNYYTDDKSSNKIFNKILTSELIYLLKTEQGEQRFPQNLSFINTDNWLNENENQNIQDAQSYIGECFVWVIGEELRRLFVIGSNKDNDKVKIDNFIRQCIRIYRDSLQLINYLFISTLWDEKIKHRNINTDKPNINNFFNTSKELKLEKLRNLLQELIETFRENPELEFPLEKTDLRDINDFLKPDSKFSKACVELEKFEILLNQKKEKYGFDECDIAEISLATILSTFVFLTNYQLVSIKRIEYEESRNTAPRYIKDINILKLPPFVSYEEKISENDAKKNLIHLLKYDNTPQLTYSIYIWKGKRFINLFPFLLDYNALTNDPGFQLYLYECMPEKSRLSYFSINSEKYYYIDYKATEPKKDEIKDEKLINKLQINIRKDLVVKQFEVAMNTLLNEKTHFEAYKPKGSAISTDALPF